MGHGPGQVGEREGGGEHRPRPFGDPGVGRAGDQRSHQERARYEAEDQQPPAGEIKAEGQAERGGGEGDEHQGHAQRPEGGTAATEQQRGEGDL